MSSREHPKHDQAEALVLVRRKPQAVPTTTVTLWLRGQLQLEYGATSIERLVEVWELADVLIDPATGRLWPHLPPDAAGGLKEIRSRLYGEFARRDPAWVGEGAVTASVSPRRFFLEGVR